MENAKIRTGCNFIFCGTNDDEVHDELDAVYEYVNIMDIIDIELEFAIARLSKQIYQYSK